MKIARRLRFTPRRAFQAARRLAAGAAVVRVVALAKRLQPVWLRVSRRRCESISVSQEGRDLGCSVCNLGGVGLAHQFRTKTLTPARAGRPGPFHCNGDAESGEGSSTSPGDHRRRWDARVIARGEPSPANLAVAFEIARRRRSPKADFRRRTTNRRGTRCCATPPRARLAAVLRRLRVPSAHVPRRVWRPHSTSRRVLVGAIAGVDRVAIRAVNRDDDGQQVRDGARFTTSVSRRNRRFQP